MNQQALEDLLKQSFADMRLSGEEKADIRDILAHVSETERRFMRNRAFAIVSEYVMAEPNSPTIPAAIKWLEQCVKTLDIFHPPILAPEAYFSPGDDCLKAILRSLASAKKCVDVCVFTISENQLAEALIEAFKRGVEVRIISDDEKSFDTGSDIQFLIRAGIPVKMDKSEAHMHHKFAIVDGEKLINGSFNWTRSATSRNEENILITHDLRAVQQYQSAFEKLWAEY